MYPRELREEIRCHQEGYVLFNHALNTFYLVTWRQTYGKWPHRLREDSRCSHISYSFRLAARVLLYAPSHRQDSTYHILCYYTNRGALAGTKNSSMGPPHEGSIRRPIAPWANALTTELHLAPPLPPLHGLLFTISSEGSFIFTILHTG